MGNFVSQSSDVCLINTFWSTCTLSCYKSKQFVCHLFCKIKHIIIYKKRLEGFLQKHDKDMFWYSVYFANVWLSQLCKCYHEMCACYQISLSLYKMEIIKHKQVAYINSELTKTPKKPMRTPTQQKQAHQ